MIKCKCGVLCKNWYEWMEHMAEKPYVPLWGSPEEVERRKKWEELHVMVKSRD